MIEFNNLTVALSKLKQFTLMQRFFFILVMAIPIIGTIRYLLVLRKQRIVYKNYILLKAISNIMFFILFSFSFYGNSIAIVYLILLSHFLLLQLDPVLNITFNLQKKASLFITVVLPNSFLSIFFLLFVAFVMNNHSIKVNSVQFFLFITPIFLTVGLNLFFSIKETRAFSKHILKDKDKLKYRHEWQRNGE